MEKAIELSIVLPCLNEAETIGICIAKSMKSLQQHAIMGEILIADNGSTDNSREIASSMGARIIEVPVKGYGSALNAGFQNANGKFILMADADDSYSLDDIGKFIGELRNGADLVMGNRFAGVIHKGAMPWLHRYIGNPLLSFIGRLFFKSKIKDFHCGIRGLNRERILKLNLSSKGMEFASEIIVKATMSGYHISEVATDLKQDGRTRPPHLKTWRDGWRHLRFLLSYSPRWLFFYPGSIFALTGFLGFITLINGEKEFFNIKLNYQSLVFFTFLLISGTQLIWFAFLAKASSIVSGYMPIDKKWEKLLLMSKKDKFYLVYLSMIATGIIILFRQIYIWASVSFGTLNQNMAIRTSLMGGILIFLGLQALSSHFLLSIILIGKYYEET